MPYKQRLEKVRFLPLSLYHEMHDLLFLHKVAHNNYDCHVYDHVMSCTKNYFETRQVPRNAFHYPKIEKTKEQEQFLLPCTFSGKQIVSLSWIRSDNVELQNFLKEKLIEKCWKFFYEKITESDLCIWRTNFACNCCLNSKNFDIS